MTAFARERTMIGERRSPSLYGAQVHADLFRIEINVVLLRRSSCEACDKFPLEYHIGKNERPDDDDGTRR